MALNQSIAAKNKKDQAAINVEKNCGNACLQKLRLCSQSAKNSRPLSTNYIGYIAKNVTLRRRNNSWAPRHDYY